MIHFKINNVLLFVFLFFTQIIFGQTDKHLKVSGTKCSLIPPTGFVSASTFSGFQNVETGASIMINELPTSYHSLVGGFTKEALLTRGIVLNKTETIDFNGTKAVLFSVAQAANGTTYLKQMLVFGDSTNTVMVNGIYPEASKNIEGQIREALLSTVYDKTQDENPLEAAIFTINIEGTDFKLIKYMSGSLLYSVDGKVPTEKPTLIVGNSFAKIPAQNQKKYAEDRLKKLPGAESYRVKEVNTIAIDNLQGYEIIANGKTKDGKAELIYQVMLFTEEDDYFIILGQTKEDFEQYLATFKNVAKTFKRK